jgi:HSP20 family protein
MPISDILPWNRNNNRLPVRRNQDDLSLSVPEQISRTMDEFFNDPFGMSPFDSLMSRMDSFSPKVDVIENDKDLKIVAEVPGMTEKDIEVTLSDGVLRLSGYKESEKEEKGKRFHRMERISGSFLRDIPLPVEVNEDKIEAIFKNGVITITLPKISPSSSRGRHIPINNG